MGRVGTLMGPETHLRMPLSDFNKIHKELVNNRLDLGDATPIIRTLRLVKSEGEIEKITHICHLVSDLFSVLPTLIKTGDTERDIFRQFKIESLQRGVDDVPYLVGGAGVGGYKDIISPPSHRATRPGDVLMLDTGSVFDGYFCDFDRNFTFGKPSDQVRRANDLLYEAIEAGQQTAREGMPVSAVFHSMWRKLETWGNRDNAVGRMGHGLGMQLTEWPSLTATDQTILQPGMVITLEPSLEVNPGRMMVHEENIVIRESGAELLTIRAPKALPVI